jgi:sulfur-oxidizing protein SoxY
VLFLRKLAKYEDDTSMKRREFVKNTLISGAAVATASLLPQSVLAEWPEAAFHAEITVDEALNALLGSSELTESSEIDIKAPDIAENGAVVPVQVSTNIANVESISIISVNNPAPLIASFNFAANNAGYISTRIKMGKTSDVVAIVKADGKLFSAKKEVKVTIGGCGG